MPVFHPDVWAILSSTNRFFIGTIPLYFTIERFGRRPIMLGGTIVETIMMLLFMIMIALPNQTSATQWTAVAFICVFICTFGYSTAGMIWLYSAEIAPLEYRHIGTSLSSFGEWLATFLTTFAGPIGITNVGWKLYLWILAGDICFVLFIYFLCPETTGLTLEQIDNVFASGGKVLVGDEEIATPVEKAPKADSVELEDEKAVA